MGKSEEIAALQFLIGSLNGQTQRVKEGQQQQQQQNVVEGQRAFREQETQNQRLFAEQQAQDSRDATIARDTSRFAHEKEMFSAKPNRQDLHEVARIGGVRDNQRGANVDVSDIGDGAGGIDPKKLTQSLKQGNYLKNQIIDIQNMTDEEFESSRDSENISAASIKGVLEKAGFPSAVGDLLRIRKGETKEGYLKRLNGFRKSIISREVKFRMGKEDFSKEVTGGSLGGVTTRQSNASEAAAQKTRVKSRIESEVAEEFGGVIG